MRMKLDMAKIDRLPELAERMMKPVEKIDSIRINHVSGLGFGGGGGGEGGGSQSPMNSAVDSVLNLALQMPTMQKLGRSIGLNLDLDHGEASDEVRPAPRRQKSTKREQEQ